jgi:hypothetical protein
MARSGKSNTSSGELSTRNQAIAAAARDPAIVQLLSQAWKPECREALTQHLVAIAPTLASQDSKGACRKFLNWCQRAPALPLTLQTAISASKSAAIRHRREKRTIIRSGNLNSKNLGKNDILEKIPMKIIREPRSPYPPPLHWVYESKRIKNRWKRWIQEEKQADSRLPRRAMAKLDPKKIRHNVLAHESIGFADKKGRIICIVIRNFCPDDRIISWGDGIVKESVPLHRSIRVRFHIQTPLIHI